MFTARFITVPIKRFSPKQMALTGKANMYDSELHFAPFDIAHYGPTWNDEESDLELVQLMLKSGMSFTVYLNIDKFETLLNNHAKEISTT